MRVSSGGGIDKLNELKVGTGLLIPLLFGGVSSPALEAEQYGMGVSGVGLIYNVPTSKYHLKRIAGTINAAFGLGGGSVNSSAFELGTYSSSAGARIYSNGNYVALNAATGNSVFVSINGTTQHILGVGAHVFNADGSITAANHELVRTSLGLNINVPTGRAFNIYQNGTPYFTFDLGEIKIAAASAVTAGAQSFGVISTSMFANAPSGGQFRVYINAAQQHTFDVGKHIFNAAGTVTAANYEIVRTSTSGALNYNVPTGIDHIFSVNGGNTLTIKRLSTQACLYTNLASGISIHPSSALGGGLYLYDDGIGTEYSQLSGSIIELYANLEIKFAGKEKTANRITLGSSATSTIDSGYSGTESKVGILYAYDITTGTAQWAEFSVTWDGATATVTKLAGTSKLVASSSPAADEVGVDVNSGNLRFVNGFTSDRAIEFRYSTHVKIGE